MGAAVDESVSAVAIPLGHSPVTLGMTREGRIHAPAYGAHVWLRIGRVVLARWMGIGKVTMVSNADRLGYLAPRIVPLLRFRLLRFSAQTAVYVVGVVWIRAAAVVAIKPRYVGCIVALWLAGILADLTSYSDFYNIAQRDFGHLIGVLALAGLAWAYDPLWGMRRLSSATQR